MFLPKPFTVQIDMASATAAFLPSEKANLEPLPRWGGGGAASPLCRTAVPLQKGADPRSGSRNDNGMKCDRADLKFLYWLCGASDLHTLFR